jgi:hypothetical protein
MRWRALLRGGARRLLLLPAALAILAGGARVGAAPAAAAEQDAALLWQLTQLRAVFLRRVDEEGYRLCAAPQIEFGAVPDFGRYLPERDAIVITPWSQLSPEERQAFTDVARANAPAPAARAVFESGTYRWVFVHELGHWWQHCRQLARPLSYATESGANRIALAFWRERDPRYAAAIVEGFQELLASVSPPLPADEPVPQYFDSHISDILHTHADTWFQAHMIVALELEQPRPSFHKALSQPLFPW